VKKSEEILSIFYNWMKPKFFPSKPTFPATTIDEGSRDALPFAPAGNDGMNWNPD
jgi:hypothetical protein